MALAVTFFAGTSFRWRERDALKRDLDHEREVVRNVQKSNSQLAERFNEANEPAMYRGVSIQRVIPRFNDTRPTRYSCFGNGVFFYAETLDEAIEHIDRYMRLQAQRVEPHE